MKRFYRDFHKNSGKHRFVVTVEESDLLIVMSQIDDKGIPIIIEEAQELVYQAITDIREAVKECIKIYPDFLTTLEPLKDTELKWLEEYHAYRVESVRKMVRGSSMANVGPMAAVAGVTSEYVGKKLMERYGKISVFIENGGDLFIHNEVPSVIGIYAGENKFKDLLCLKVDTSGNGMGVCTSAGKLGHSLSFGEADAVVVLSKDTALADCTATSCGNRIKTPEDIEEVLKYGMSIDGVLGVVIIAFDTLGALGDIEFC